MERVVNPDTYFNLYYPDHSLLSPTLVLRFPDYAYQTTSPYLQLFHALYSLHYNPTRI